MMGAGPVAKKACELGLEGSYMRLTKPWIKTSLAPVSGVITKYLLQSGLHSTRTSRDFILLAIGAPHVLRAQETLMNELLLQFPTNENQNRLWENDSNEVQSQWSQLVESRC